MNATRWPHTLAAREGPARREKQASRSPWSWAGRELRAVVALELQELMEAASIRHRLVVEERGRHAPVGMDVVEIAPSFDYANGLTCIMAGRLILNVLSSSWGEGGAFRGRPPRAMDS